MLWEGSPFFQLLLFLSPLHHRPIAIWIFRPVDSSWASPSRWRISEGWCIAMGSLPKKSSYAERHSTPHIAGTTEVIPQISPLLQLSGTVGAVTGLFSMFCQRHCLWQLFEQLLLSLCGEWRACLKDLTVGASVPTFSVNKVCIEFSCPFSSLLTWSTALQKLTLYNAVQTYCNI